ncbi:MAG: ferredoxin family protein [Phycisphaerae bacterium]|nr:ferredoxin family protein [Phycisphaerae bacterium]
MAEKALTIYCHCAYYDLVRPEVKSDVLDAIKAGGVQFEAVPDLCRMCADGDPRLKEWAKARPLRIFACYPRAVKWLFHAAGAPLGDQGVEFINMRTGDIESQISNFKLEIRDSKLQDRDLHLKSEISNLKSEIQDGDWVPWFPVIDYDRCQNCKQCYGFCLFGVFQVSEDDKVEVRNPANCKTNCPACAKACPHSAIIFPKYSDGPVNGDEPDEPVHEQEAKVGLGDLLGGDPYGAIRKRGKGAERFSAGAKAGASGFKDMQERLGIPADVLSSLSSAELAGIRRKAGKKGANLRHNDGERSESEDNG